MKGSSLNVEKIIYDNSMDIEIDQRFKHDLKKRIMSNSVLEADKVTQFPQRSKMPYMKVASWVIFAALSGGAIFGAGHIYSNMTAVNNVAQNTASTQKNNNKDAVKSNNGNAVNLPAAAEQVASADIKSDTDKNQTPAVTLPVEPPKTDTKVSASKGTTKPEDQATSGTTSKANINTNINNAVTAPTKSADTPSDTSTAASNNTPAATEPVKTINLTMEAGRYLIKNISVTGSEVVETLPQEYKSLTAEECAKLPPASSGQIVYEKDGEVHMINHVNSKDITVDKGKTPVLYAPIGLVSYIKDAASSDNTGSKNSSEVWIFDSNSTNKYNVLSSENGNYSYINTFWSSDGKALYILEENNSTNKYDLLKLTLDIE